MAEQWYCQIAGRVIGPVSLEQLQAAADQGKLLPADRVRPGIEGDWARADGIAGLFDAAGNPAADRAPPPHGAQPTSGAQPPSAVPGDSQPGAASPDHAQPGAAVLHGSQTLAASLLRRKSRQRRQMLFTGLLVFAGSAVLIAVLVWQSGGLANFTGEIKQGGGLVGMAKEAKKHAGEPREPLDDGAAAAMNEEEAGLADGEKKSADAALETSAAKEEPAANKDDGKWVDASMSRVTLDQIPIKITSVAWQARKLNTIEGAYLVIHVEVENTSRLPDSRLSFEGWSLDAPRRWVRMTDDQETLWPAREANPANTVANMLPIRLGPDKIGNDVLLFDTPNPRVKYLRLELSGEAIGKEGTAYFQIPAKMIRGLPTEAELAPPKPAKKKSSKPVKRVPTGPTGNPELDFGIRPEDAPPTPK